MTTGMLHEDKADERDDSADSSREDGRPVPAGNGTDGEREDHPGQAEGSEGGTNVVEARRRGLIAARGEMAQGGPSSKRREGQVDEEDQPPAHGGRQVAADDGSDGYHHAPQARPGADRRRTVLRMERGLDDGETPRREQRGSHPLKRPGYDQ